MAAAEIDTVLTADSVEWCPQSGFEHILACGTYQLEDGGTRRGSLSMFEWAQATSQLKQILLPGTRKLSDGILDMKWCTVSTSGPLLALASSQGCAVFVKLEQTSPSDTTLCEVARATVAAEGDKQGLCLSLDWSKDQSSQPVTAVSDSLGRISMVELADGGSSRLLYGWKAHEYEAWIVALGYQPCIVFSGGDDCRLCMWDTRTGYVKPSFTSKRHQMGVCSLQIHPFKEHILASGSYDETLVLWDTRRMATPVKDVCLGGGVWRIKWHWDRHDLLAAACMHNGFSMVNCNLDSGNPMEVVCSYDKHKSLAYGIDWCRLESNQQKQPSDDTRRRGLLASCSFYDHSLHLWTAELPISQ